MALVGRWTERTAIQQLLSAARSGRSGTLLLLGDAGIGKTALLEDAESEAGGFSILRGIATAAERDIPFALVQQLVQTLDGPVADLPPLQRQALSVALGLAAGPPPDPLAVGLGLLGVLADLSRRRPILCVVDDVHWADEESAQILGIVARRLSHEPVVFLLAARTPADLPALAGVDRLTLAGLSTRDAARLLAEVVPGLLDPQVRNRLAIETGGNPLALMELPHGLSSAELAGGFEVSGIPLEARIDDSFRRRLNDLPRSTRRLLLLAAAEPTGSRPLLVRAARGLDLEVADATPALRSGLLRPGQFVVFRHPVVRALVYSSASDADRREVHHALALATDPHHDPDRRAWHRAQATAGIDDAVADELERSASRARQRGGVAAAAQLLERAAELSSAEDDRVRRSISAGEHHLLAGQFDAVRDLADRYDVLLLPAHEQARLARLQARAAFATDSSDHAAKRLLAAARSLDDVDQDLAQETYFDALWAATVAGEFLAAETVEELTSAALYRPAPRGEPAPVDLMVRGMALALRGRLPDGAPMLREALDQVRRAGGGDHQDARWLWVSIVLWDAEAWSELAGRQVQLVRAQGALSELGLVLDYLAGLHHFRGDFATAKALIDEADDVAAAIGRPRPRYLALPHAAFRGDEAEVAFLVEQAVADGQNRHDGLAIGAAGWAHAVLCNSLGRYEEAFTSATTVVRTGCLAHAGWALPEVVEAATRLGEIDVARRALAQLAEHAAACQTPWVLGVEAMCKALVGGDTAVELSFRAAIDHLAPTGFGLHIARARLLYGEWLRRQRRRTEARAQLRAASDLFEACGAEGFGWRARRELEATGQRVTPGRSAVSPALTPQEQQVASLAATGLSNAEIGTRMFISPRTVEYHLSKVFDKLGVTSRHHLGTTLSRPG